MVYRVSQTDVNIPINSARKIIFISSTSHSGSTMLDLMLANDPNGFSCGEVYALFRPYRPHHINPICKCGIQSCELWAQVLKKGEAGLYQTIFELNPGLNFIVDSSKMLSWTHDQLQYLKSQPYKVIHIVIWKTPLEYAYSCLKRTNSMRWKRRYKSYYRHFFELVDDWISVSYADLAQQPGPTLQNLCQRIGIPYYPGKELFWNGKYHSLFGSGSTELHTIQASSAQFKEYSDRQRSIKSRQDASMIDEITHHRSFYYDPHITEKLPQKVVQSAHADKKLVDIVKRFGSNPQSNGQKIIRQPGLWLHLERIRYRFLYLKNVQLKHLLAKISP